MRRIRVVVVFLALAAVVLGVTAPLAALEVGGKAPEFTLPSTTKEKFSLKEFEGKKSVVLFGFIGAFTPT